MTGKIQVEDKPPQISRNSLQGRNSIKSLISKLSAHLHGDYVATATSKAQSSEEGTIQPVFKTCELKLAHVKAWDSGATRQFCAGHIYMQGTIQTDLQTFALKLAHVKAKIWPCIEEIIWALTEVRRRNSGQGTSTRRRSDEKFARTAQTRGYARGM